MKSFLQYVAESLIEKYGTDLSRTAVVFPNKRAALFLNEHLARLAGHPIWSPAYITISELFRHHSEREVADPIKLVCDLHRCFTEATGFDETLDHFYGWGQLLLADFDDVDKNMADADKVFANLRDIHELDDVSYLNDDQKAIIRRFFGNFSDDHNTELKKRFLQLWSRMGDIYHTFNDCLSRQQLAYEGALYREVAEHDDLTFEYERYVFVGFNLLQRVEQRLFKTLKDMGKAVFYWDFDHYYMPHSANSHEAGHYIAQYLADFPNELDIKDADIYGQFARPRTITYISAPTENIQARYISHWLKELRDDKGTYTRIEDGRRTAIVLSNEGLLQTVVHSLPEEIQKVNVTTGYPLIQSPVASLVSEMLALQTIGFSTKHNRFRHSQVSALLNHPYTKYLGDEAPSLLVQRKDTNADLLHWICDTLQHIAREVEREDMRDERNDTRNDLQLLQESVFRMYTLMNRLSALIESGELVVDIITLQRLISQLVSSASIPFHGEPVEGLQVMGVLETRNLDFDHLLLLSCNEGNLPKGVNDTSFIPYSIRKAYGLTTIDHKVAIYSYYFHRLLQRAGDITILYNNATSDGQRAEKSRFMLQQMVESPHQFRFLTLQAGQQFTPFVPKAIEKTPDIMQKLHRRFDISRNHDASSPLLTPTAINRYMRCPLTFYYTYACGLREQDNIEEDVIDNRAFGNIFHEAAQTIYTQLMQRSRCIEAKDIDDILKKRVDIERAVDKAMQEELLLKKSDHQELEDTLNGLQLINRQVIIQYLRRLLDLDRRLAPFSIIGLECDTVTRLDTTYLSTIIGGRIDRLDKITETDPQTGQSVERIRVVDYKTGSRKLTPLRDVEAIFGQDSLSKHSDYYLQTFLYGCIVRKSRQFNPHDLPVSPALLFIQHAGADDYDPILAFGKQRIDDVEDDRQQFGSLLKEKIDEIFDPTTAFSPTPDRERCLSCSYRQLCRLVVTLLICLSAVTGFANHRVWADDVKSLQVVANTDWLSMPILQLGSDDVLNVAFDQLSHDYHRYVAHLEHCEADWSTSEEIFESDWLQGFNDIPLSDYEKSINTTVLYTHYTFQVPNDQCRLKMSGNYRLHILDEDDDNRCVLTAEFRVVEPKMNVGLSASANTDLGLNGRYQQLSMSVNYNALPVTRPDEQLYILVMQNGREDNMKVNVKPNFITPKGLKWEYNKRLIFEAGNEYHKYEVLNPTHITLGLERVSWDEDEGRFHVFPWLCEPQRNYLYDEDANGAFYIRNSDNYENDRTSDYVYVHYKLQPARHYDHTNIILEGKWTTEDPSTYVMEYDDADQSYNATVLQKMGYYNYQFLMLDPDGTTHRVPEEGSFYQTENQYQALVYYKGIGERTWRLVGYQEITFRAN